MKDNKHVRTFNEHQINVVGEKQKAEQLLRGFFELKEGKYRDVSFRIAKEDTLFHINEILDLGEKLTHYIDDETSQCPISVAYYQTVKEEVEKIDDYYGW